MLLPLLLLSVADVAPIESHIADVTLYRSTALVHRTAHVGGKGTYVIPGLPQVMDPDNVRVRCSDGDVVSVEVRERVQPRAPDERLQTLRERAQALSRDLQAARDEVRVLDDMAKYLASLSEAGTKGFRADVDASRDASTAWTSSYAFVLTKLAENTKARREAGWRADDAQRAFDEVQHEIGRLSSGGNVTVRDVVVDVEAAGEATLDLEYLVRETGWEPFYDLRTSSDLASVDVGYRARIRQQTGEDWHDVAIALSTAEPQRGAQGPEPVPQWITMIDPDAVVVSRKMEGFGYGSVDRKAAAGVDLAEDKAVAQTPFATVEEQGLSVRFQIPRAKRSSRARSRRRCSSVGRRSP